MLSVYIGIGSNLGNPKEKVLQAIEALKTLPDSRFICASSLYGSKPMGPSDQPDYVNAVALIETHLSALNLLDHTQAIENSLGRVRKEERWGPRTLDLDLLLYANEIIQNERLTIPHYGMKVREFVLYPLAEIAPNLRFPDGELLVNCLSRVQKNGLICI